MKNLVCILMGLFASTSAVAQFPTVAAIFGPAVNDLAALASAPCTSIYEDQVRWVRDLGSGVGDFRICKDGSWVASASSAGGGVSDHGALSGLADDDHAQYALVTGRAAEDLTVQGNVIAAGTVDGRDVAADGTKLDGVEAGAQVDTNLTQEQVEDFAGNLVADGTGSRTGISVTYQDGTGDVDMVVDHDAASNFIMAKHVDWANAAAGTIHATNYVDTDTDTTCLDAGVDCLFAASLTEGGPATTATALVTNGTNCASGDRGEGVDEFGNAEGCSLVLGADASNPVNFSQHALETVEIAIKASPGTIGGCKAVRQVGWNPGAGRPSVELASNTDSTPAFGITGTEGADMTNTQPHGVLIVGTIGTGCDTSSFSEGDDLFLELDGDFMNTRPVGLGVSVQPIGMVARSHATKGVIIVNVPGSYVQIPNIPDDTLWLGNSSHAPAESAIPDCDSGFGALKYDTTTNAFTCAGSTATAIDADQDATKELSVDNDEFLFDSDDDGTPEWTMGANGDWVGPPVSATLYWAISPDIAAPMQVMCGKGQTGYACGFSRSGAYWLMVDANSGATVSLKGYGQGTNTTAGLVDVCLRRQSAGLYRVATNCSGATKADLEVDDIDAATSVTVGGRTLYGGSAGPPVTCAAGTAGGEYHDTDPSDSKCFCDGSTWLVDVGSGNCS